MAIFWRCQRRETADLLHVSTDTIKRDRRLAKLWLLRELEAAADDRRSRTGDAFGESATPRWGALAPTVRRTSRKRAA
jgi:hypothetical protein